MEFLPLLTDLKLIVIDYMGENKHQLNYKKVIEEYKSSYRWDYYDNCLCYNLRYRIVNWRYIGYYKTITHYEKKYIIIMRYT